MSGTWLLFAQREERQEPQCGMVVGSQPGGSWRTQACKKKHKERTDSKVYEIMKVLRGEPVLKGHVAFLEAGMEVREGHARQREQHGQRHQGVTRAHVCRGWQCRVHAATRPPHPGQFLSRRNLYVVRGPGPEGMGRRRSGCPPPECSPSGSSGLSALGEHCLPGAGPGPCVMALPGAAPEVPGRTGVRLWEAPSAPTDDRLPLQECHAPDARDAGRAVGMRTACS